MFREGKTYTAIGKSAKCQQSNGVKTKCHMFVYRLVSGLRC